MDQVAIFGDVHGHDEMLERLILEIKKENKDTELYSLGDLIDRGPGSSKVIELCIKHNVKGIMGNHELWLRGLIKNNSFDTFALEPIMGGEWTFLSYDVYRFDSPAKAATQLLQKMPASHKKFLLSLPNYRVIEVDGHKYWLIHSGLSVPAASQFRPLDSNLSDEEMMESISNSKRPENYIMWPSPNLGNRFRPDHNLYRFDKATQILGHKPVKEPMINKDFIALDTGCGTCDPFTLSAILLPSKRIIQVKEDSSWV